MKNIRTVSGIVLGIMLVGVVAGAGTVTFSTREVLTSSKLNQAFGEKHDTAAFDRYSTMLGRRVYGIGPPGPNSVSGTTASTIVGIIKGSGTVLEAAILGVDYLAPTNIVDALTSSSVVLPLSANQGRLLNNNKFNTARFNEYSTNQARYRDGYKNYSTHWSDNHKALITVVGTKANIASPVFTGTVTMAQISSSTTANRYINLGNSVPYTGTRAAGTIFHNRTAMYFVDGATATPKRMGTGTGSGTSGATNLDGLTDVVVTTPLTSQFLYHNGTNWVNGTPQGVFTNISTVSAQGTRHIDISNNVPYTGPRTHGVIFSNATTLNYVEGSTTKRMGSGGGGSTTVYASGGGSQTPMQIAGVQPLVNNYYYFARSGRYTLPYRNTSSSTRVAIFATSTSVSVRPGARTHYAKWNNYSANTNSNYQSYTGHYIRIPKNQGLDLVQFGSGIWQSVMRCSASDSGIQGYPAVAGGGGGGGGGTIVFVRGANSGDLAYATSRAVTMANTAGSAIVVAIMSSPDAIQYSALANNACTDTSGNTYVKAVTVMDGTNNQSVGLWYALNVGASGSNTITCAFGELQNYSTMSAGEYSGVATASALDITGSNVASGTTAADNATVSGSGTTTTANQLVVAAGSNTSAGGTLTAGTNYSLASFFGANSLHQQYRILSSAGTPTATWTLGTAGTYTAAILTLKAQ